jgi:hypothetical protein
LEGRLAGSMATEYSANQALAQCFWTGVEGGLAQPI